MKADVSRSTFSQRKHYRDVRWQMGRVPVDADLNEYVDIVAHRTETETRDVVGESGAPIHAAAFQLATSPAALPPAQQAAANALVPLAPGDFLLSAGRYYVDGVLCENDAPIRFSDQAGGDTPDAAPLGQAGLYLVYLDVWARHLTYLDDPAMREVALGGPDTATRHRTLWQVRALRVGAAGAAPACDARVDAYDRLVAPPTGRLAADVDRAAADTRPCILPPGGGYRRLENQLYRVEVHDPGDAGGPATFKWSRDNGAVVSGWEGTATPDAIRLTHPPRDEVMGFAVGHWVELTDDDRELRGLAGELLQVRRVVGAELTLDRAVPAGFARNPKVRRWDGVGATAIVAGGWIALEDGVRVSFTAGSYRSGDHWMIPARTATADVEWPRANGVPDFVPPHGVAHHYARLGFVSFDGAASTVTDCRRLFTPLTELDGHADLRLHNRHLHGKGVVCGLQVHCVGADREAVRVRPGHAIDCAGTDILLEAPRRLPLVERARNQGLLDAQGSGDVQLTLRADAEDQPVFDLVAAPAEPQGSKAILRHILEGTIWRDFHDECLQPLLDYLRKQLFDEPADLKGLPSPQKQRLLTALNLLAHRGGGAPKKRLWLSAEQHEMLAGLYADLAALAGRSRTTCGILDGLGEFPAYPFARDAIRTAFVAKRVRGARLVPDEPFAIAWSDDAPGHVHLIDLQAAEMVRDTELDAAQGLVVRDVAFVQFRQKAAMVVASGNADQTVLTVLDPAAGRTLDAFVLVGAAITRIEAHTRRPDVLLAMEPGTGIHLLEFERLASGPLGRPRWAFPAAGHLAVMNDRFVATQQRDGAAAGVYDVLRFGRLSPGGDDMLEDAQVPLAALDRAVTTGSDGVALVTSQRAMAVHVVVDPPQGRKAKAVLVVDAQRPARAGMIDLPAADDGGDTGPVSIDSVQNPGRVLYALAKRNQVAWVAADAPNATAALLFPAQGEPIAVAATASRRGAPFVVAANRESMTLTVLPARVLGGVDVTDAQLDAYRSAVLAAFERLVRVLAQSLKDCLCDHLLVDCPTCEPNETLPLAKIEIREGRVHHICGFDRMDVLTFPKVKYWLSAVPIIPLVGYLVERFCCWVIPSEPAATGAPTGTTTAPVAGPLGAMMSPAAALAAMDFVRAGRAGELATDNVARAKVWSTHLARAMGMRVPGVEPSPDPRVRLTDVVDRDATTATTKLAERGIAVAAVEDYDATIARDERLSVDRLPATLKPGERVKLYTRGGRVMFYQLVSDAAPPATGGGAPPAAGPDLRPEVDDLRGQLDRLRASHAAELATRDRDIADLRLANANLDAEVRRLATAPQPGAELRGALDALRADFQSLRESHANELAVRDRQLLELRTSNDRLTTELGVTTRRLLSDIERINRDRPIR